MRRRTTADASSQEESQREHGSFLNSVRGKYYLTCIFSSCARDQAAAPSLDAPTRLFLTVYDMTTRGTTVAQSTHLHDGRAERGLMYGLLKLVCFVRLPGARTHPQGTQQALLT